MISPFSFHKHNLYIFGLKLCSALQIICGVLNLTNSINFYICDFINGCFNSCIIPIIIITILIIINGIYYD